VPLLRSDYQSFAGESSYALGNQGHTLGLSSWVPYYGTGVYLSDDHFTYAARSYFTPAFGVAADTRRKDVDWDLFRRTVSQWREVIDCFLGDFYPLTSHNLSDDAWMAWQFDLPAEGRGLVQVFRHTSSPYETAVFPLRGLEPGATYVVTDLDTKAAQRLTGRALMSPGLRVAVSDKPGAVVLTYRKAR